jgi:alkylhydroperoxidase family enzyme
MALPRSRRLCHGQRLDTLPLTSISRAVTTNYERAFEGRPDVLAAWVQLNTAIKANMDLRRYELATLAAARRLHSSYCSLMHGRVLLEQFGERVREIALDRRTAGLDDVDIAVMDLAEKVVVDATSIDDRDLQPLRDLGLSEAEIRDVVLAAAARCFFAKTLDGLGVRPDASLGELDPALLDVLVVGRPIAAD